MHINAKEIGINDFEDYLHKMIDANDGLTVATVHYFDGRPPLVIYEGEYCMDYVATILHNFMQELCIENHRGEQEFFTPHSLTIDTHGSEIIFFNMRSKICMLEKVGV